MSAVRRAAQAVLERRAVVAAILSDRGDALVVTGLGAAAWDAMAAGDHPHSFYLWGGMGGAAAMGLGLALAQPARRVLVLTGDGEMLMGLGSLATIGVASPANLAVVVLDNQRYGETGMQPSHTAHGVDLAAMARAATFPTCLAIRTPEQLHAAIPQLHRAPGPIFASIAVTARPVPLVVPPRDGAYLKNRFREAVLGANAVS